MHSHHGPCVLMHGTPMHEYSVLSTHGFLQTFYRNDKCRTAGAIFHIETDYGNSPLGHSTCKVIPTVWIASRLVPCLRHCRKPLCPESEHLGRLPKCSDSKAAGRQASICAMRLRLVLSNLKLAPHHKATSTHYFNNILITWPYINNSCPEVEAPCVVAQLGFTLFANTFSALRHHNCCSISCAWCNVPRLTTGFDTNSPT